MNRRELAQTMALGLGGMMVGGARPADAQEAAKTPDVPGLTIEVAEFVAETRYEQMPKELIDLGKKSILDAIGLDVRDVRALTALCGA